MFSLDQLKIKLSSAELANVFNFLDKNQDGFVNYYEFCNLTDEKRKNTDIFDNASELKSKYSNMKSS